MPAGRSSENQTCVSERKQRVGQVKPAPDRPSAAQSEGGAAAIAAIGQPGTYSDRNKLVIVQTRERIKELSR